MKYNVTEYSNFLREKGELNELGKKVDFKKKSIWCFKKSNKSSQI